MKINYKTLINHCAAVLLLGASSHAAAPEGRNTKWPHPTLAPDALKAEQPNPRWVAEHQDTDPVSSEEPRKPDPAPVITQSDLNFRMSHIALLPENISSSGIDLKELKRQIINYGELIQPHSAKNIFSWMASIPCNSAAISIFMGFTDLITSTTHPKLAGLFRWITSLAIFANVPSTTTALVDYGVTSIFTWWHQLDQTELQKLFKHLQANADATCKRFFGNGAVDFSATQGRVSATTFSKDQFDASSQSVVLYRGTRLDLYSAKKLGLFSAPSLVFSNLPRCYIPSTDPEQAAKRLERRFNQLISSGDLNGKLAQEDSARNQLIRTLE